MSGDDFGADVVVIQYDGGRCSWVDVIGNESKSIVVTVMLVLLLMMLVIMALLLMMMLTTIKNKGMNNTKRNFKLICYPSQGIPAAYS